MPKKKVFYAIVIYDDERSGGEIKEYCRTKKIAERELKKYRDFMSSKPPKPDERHIRKLWMTIE